MSIAREGRIPRAPNLKSAKLLLKKAAEREFLTHDSFRNIGRNVLRSSDRQYSDEYLTFFVLLGFLRKIRDTIIMSEADRLLIAKFSDEKELTDYEIAVFRDRLLRSNSVRWFLKEIFCYDVMQGKWVDGLHALKLKDIAKEYMRLTSLSPATSRREAKLLKDWLGQVNVIEQSFNKKYYLTFGTISLDMFDRTFEERYRQLEESNASGTRWMEIAPIQASICEDFGISKSQFDTHFRRFVESQSGIVSTSPGSAGLEEVRRFGVAINNRLIYYVKFNR